jgi:8-oxo-dGTP diphosphatase
MMTGGSLQDIDWDAWQPQQRATLLFVVRDGDILLIHKKLGLGAGKINGPGGRIEPDETPEQAAVREVREELHTVARHVSKSGELFFQFIDGLSLHVHVFRADDCDGEPRETGEAVPIWVDVEGIPYEEMWEDDPYWIPLMLNRTPFRGFFLFDNDHLLDHRVETGQKS